MWGQIINIFTKKFFKLQNRPMRILSFSDFYANADPIYKMFNILKLNDNIALLNCLFVHDFFNNISYFQAISDIHSINTKSSELVCIHIHFFAITKYGLNSFTRKCVDSWNFFTQNSIAILLN